MDPRSPDLCVPCSYVSEVAQTTTSVSVTLLGGKKRGDVVNVSNNQTSKNSSYLVPFDTKPFVAQPDLIQIASLSEETLLHNLRARYDNDQIYTSIGDILISVNPFKQLRLYTPAVLAQYLSGHSNTTTTTNTNTGSGSGNDNGLPPHIYGSAVIAYESMVRDRTNQSLIISGESGAGKTECMKLLMQLLTEKSQQSTSSSGDNNNNNNNNNSDNNNSSSSSRNVNASTPNLKRQKSKRDTDGLEQRVLAANPILEAFGNSATVRNHNSSRFGKWTSILFDALTGNIQGCAITPYMLEKSRVAHHGTGERNYHIFYQLLAFAQTDDIMAQRFSLTQVRMIV